MTPQTGSILVHHEPAQELEELLEHAGLITDVIVEALLPWLRAGVRSEAGRVSRRANDWFFDLGA